MFIQEHPNPGDIVFCCEHVPQEKKRCVWFKTEKVELFGLKGQWFQMCRACGDWTAYEARYNPNCILDIPKIFRVWEESKPFLLPFGEMPR